MGVPNLLHRSLLGMGATENYKPFKTQKLLSDLRHDSCIRCDDDALIDDTGSDIRFRYTTPKTLKHNTKG